MEIVINRNELIFHEIKTTVEEWISKNEDNMLSCEIKIEVMRNEKDGYWIILEFPNCLGQIIIENPTFAPYRFVFMEIQSKISKENEIVYMWMDGDDSTVNEIISKIDEGIKKGQKYMG